MHIAGPKTYAQPVVKPEASPRSAADNKEVATVTLPETGIIRWWFEPGQARLARIWSLLAASTIVLFYTSKPPAVSPLISGYIDILDPQSAWAVGLINEQGGLSFWLSLLFVVSTSLFLLVTFVVSLGSGPKTTPEPEQIRTRYFGTAHLAGRSSKLRLGAIVMIIMLVSNVGLFYFLAQKLEQPDQALNGMLFRITYFVAILSRLFGLFLGLGIVIQLFLQDFWGPILKFYRAYRGYFYPPLLAIAIVAFVFTQMDQFDGLFIELVTSWGNFLLFSLFLFPASIVIIWFTPSYLAFTDRQFASRQDSWDIVSRLSDDDPKFKRSPGLYAWTILHKRLFPQLDMLNSKPVPAQYLAGKMDKANYPSAGFHRFRTFLAMVYILTLVNICAKVYFDNQPDPPIWGSFIVPITAVLALLYIVLALRQTNIAARENDRFTRTYPKVEKPYRLGFLAALEERVRQKRNREGELYFKETDEVTYVQSRKIFLVGFILSCGAVLLFLTTLILIIIQGVQWQFSFQWLLGFLILSVFGFAWLSLYQPFFGDYTFNEIPKQSRWPTDKTMDRLDHLVTQAMLLVNPIIASCALAFFFTGLFWQGFVSSAFVAWLNPLNIYLLLINGLIAGIILLDRFILLRDRKKQYRRAIDGSNKIHRWGGVSTANLVWGFAVIGVVLASAYLGNSYHEIPYRQPTAALQQGIELDDYVKDFVSDDQESGPVIFIASDGGGLKACYWTMLNLYKLDTMGLYDGNVFALSGASGGTIGLSMYNYLKARGTLDAEIPAFIEAIGDGNFLSGDFAGLLTRFPINYWPNLPDLEPDRWDDRMESMARSYFRIVGKESDRFNYDAIRQQPFWYPWTQREKLPLLIVNSARAEDGRLGTVTPLADNPLTGSIDLTRNGRGEAISYPDATFLSNRFPIASPAARIIGKGHFLDAGSADNSGLNSLYGLIRELKSRQLAMADTVRTNYDKLFDRGIVVISLRNAESRYVRDEFLGVLDSINRYPYKSEFSANTGVAVNTGLTGVPISWDDYLRDTVVQRLGLVDTFVTINLPFRLRKGDVFSALGGELRYPQLDAHRNRLNHEINAVLGPDSAFAVMPPLGRVLALPIRTYMEEMLAHPQVQGAYEGLQKLER